MKIAVFTHVEHKKEGDSYYAYGPYIWEMNLWFRKVNGIEIVAPAGTRANPANQCYSRKDIIFTEIPAINFKNGKNFFTSILRLPLIVSIIFTSMKRADHLHLRCPGNIGLLACLVQIMFPGKRKTAKYAGNWDPGAVQPWSYKFQKWVLNNTFLTRNMKVLVYGDWPEQTRIIHSFFTASFSEKQISAVREKNFSTPINFLFVGNLVPGKNPLIGIQLVKEIIVLRNLTGQFPKIFLKIYGDGVDREMLESFCKEEKLEGLVQFFGNRPLEELKEAYQNAHFIILPSQSEGWPKAIAEGMFFGCIPIATAVSCVPWMLNYGSRGVLIPVAARGEESNEKRIAVEWGERKVESLEVKKRMNTKKSEKDVIEETGVKIITLIQDPEKMRRMSLEAQKWSQQYTLERFENAIQEVLSITQPFKEKLKREV